MKLCWLIPSDQSGGISPVALSCCRQAAQAGYETTMLMLLPPSWIGNDYDFRVISLNLSSSAPKAPQVLLQWLQKNQQDVLFFNGCSEFDPIIAYLHSSVKCVYVVHDTAPSYWRQAIEDSDNLEAIVAVSETVANQFRDKLKQPQKLSVICNGSVFPEIPNLKDNIIRDELVFLGGDNPTKGSFDVIKLWKQLVKLGFTGKLHWFGKMAPEFENKIQQLPNSQQIHIYGYVQRELIFTTAASAKVLLMLSRVEPFGMSTIEAMSMGCVPVAWDINTGTKEIVTPQTGLFAPLGNVKVLAKQVIYACEAYEILRNAVIERARSNFNEIVMWNQYESLLKDISNLKPIERSQKDQEIKAFQPPVRHFQLLPPKIRSLIREFIGRSPILGYLLRDLRGW
ncbi:MAG: glycosyltransferase [Calothrix sp. C42_A2020_038]|nr:glycosyltransferase [Calothrix sp. C42_A2020_038]